MPLYPKGRGSSLLDPLRLRCHTYQNLDTCRQKQTTGILLTKKKKLKLQRKKKADGINQLHKRKSRSKKGTKAIDM